MSDPRVALAELFREQARACRSLGSPLWGAMGDHLAADAERGGPAGATATARAPLAWLRLEPHGLPYPELRLTTWPGGEERVLANCSFHLGPVEWLG